MTHRRIAPDACTLPKVEQPLRVDEFEAVFAAYMRQVEEVSPTKVRMTLAGPDELAEQIQDLVERETACCSFFTFTLSKSRSNQPELALHLDIEVPADYTEVLTALANRAKRAQKKVP